MVIQSTQRTHYLHLYDVTYCVLLEYLIGEEYSFQGDSSFPRKVGTRLQNYVVSQDIKSGNVDTKERATLSSRRRPVA